MHQEQSEHQQTRLNWQKSKGHRRNSEGLFHAADDNFARSQQEAESVEDWRRAGRQLRQVSQAWGSNRHDDRRRRRTGSNQSSMTERVAMYSESVIMADDGVDGSESVNVVDSTVNNSLLDSVVDAVVTTIANVVVYICVINVKKLVL
jgi:hypothetical protein